MPLEPCPNDINEAPGDPTLSPSQRLDLKIERVWAILDKYESLIFEPTSDKGDVSAANPGYATYEFDVSKLLDEYKRLKLLDEYERLRYKVFIGLSFVTDDADQSKLPPEERIPHCLEGVPVHFLTNRPYITIGN